MFGFLKKKEAPKADPAPAQSEALKAFAAQFAPEEMSVLAVTGANGFSGSKSGEGELWTASIGLTAWIEEDSTDIHREEIGLVVLADDHLLAYLRQRTPPDFIIKFRARLALDGKRLLLLDLPEPGFDPDLKAILTEQKRPESTYVDGLGTFTLNRQVNWFQTEVEWLGQPVQLTFDRDEDRADCCQTAKALLDDQAGWDSRIRDYAAQELLSLANDWASDGAGDEGGEPEELTRESFIARMELESIQVYEDDSFEFWFNDGEMFWGHSIRVSGSLTDGPTDAQMEG